ncbi:MAG: S9 family peptidase [Parvularculaceae bacterium]|nr:S9 family peptidase [Parvularculaceae bacterium]
MTKTIQLSVSAFAISLAPATAWADNHPAPATLSALDVFELEWADDPQIAPDEQYALYSRRGFDIMSDRSTRDVWLVALDGSSHEPLLSGIRGLRSPRWSPSGDRIAFLASSGEGRTSLFIHYLASGRTGEMASFGESPGNLTWSPDGEHLAFTMSVKAKPKKLVKGPKKPEGAKWAKAPNLIERARYRTNGSGFLELAYQHIFVVPAEGGTARQLTDGDFNHGGRLSFTPDGDAIIFSANRHEDWEMETYESDIFSVSISDGTLSQLTDAPGAEQSPQVSPDGKHIVYQQWDNEAQNPYIMPKIVVMHTDGSSPVTLAADMDRRLQAPRWTSETEIAVTYHDEGEQRLARLSLDGDVKQDWATISGTTIGRPYLSGSYDHHGDTLLYTKGSAHRPADLYVRNASGKDIQLTSLNEDLLAHRQLGEVQAFTYGSPHDGQEIDGWMITPPDYEEGKSYPLIIEIHGGPHLSYGPHFSAELQRMAAAGYVVVYDNHRGSSGYGEGFGQLLKFKYSSKEDFADHMGAVDWAVEKGYADADNLFIAGGSAGGIATAYAVGLTDRFKAAVAAKPVINWISKTLTADSYIGQQRHQFPGPPWEHLDHYWERSPLSLVGNVSTPTMLITGEVDWRTPMSETEQFYQALQLRGVPTAMVRIPGANHGIAGRPSRLNAKVDYTLAWFERYKEEKPED